jgi:hypothetical protein
LALERTFEQDWYLDAGWALEVVTVAQLASLTAEAGPVT